MCEKQLNPVSVAELQAKRMTRKEASLKSLVFLNLLIHPLQRGSARWRGRYGTRREVGHPGYVHLARPGSGLLVPEPQAP